MTDHLGQLTTTSYALLGQLARRPWSTYELSKSMARNYNYFWPRAKSLLYRELQRLASLGLVEGTDAPVGRRRRTIYAIKPAGRRALRAWMRTEPRTFALEFEGLLRVWLAPHGDREDLLRALSRVEADAEQMLRVAGVIVPEYLEGSSPAQGEVHTRAFVVDFLARYAELVRSWAARSRGVVESWHDLASDGKVSEALETIRAAPRLEPRETDRARFGAG
jgi:DNA-binding PadR family transcriptional regulator